MTGIVYIVELVPSRQAIGLLEVQPDLGGHRASLRHCTVVSSIQTAVMPGQFHSPAAARCSSDLLMGCTCASAPLQPVNVMAMSASSADITHGPGLFGRGKRRGNSMRWVPAGKASASERLKRAVVSLCDAVGGETRMAM